MPSKFLSIKVLKPPKENKTKQRTNKPKNFFGLRNKMHENSALIKFEMPGFPKYCNMLYEWVKAVSCTEICLVE